MKPSSLVILTDQEELGLAIERAVTRSPRLSGYVSCLRTTYARQRLFLSTEIIEDSTLFVLELMRDYGGWHRAEGLAAAMRLHATYSKASLIVSYYSLGGAVVCPWYWDLGCSESLGQRIASLLRGETVWTAFDLLPVERLFAASLELPREHESGTRAAI